MKRMAGADLEGRRVLIREDLNVPMKNGRIANDNRIRAALPTIRAALEAGGGVIVMSHLGRPAEGERDEAFSLAPVAKRLEELLERPVRFVADYLENPPRALPGEVVLLENVRFNRGEKKNDPELGKKLAALADVFVMDAFATAHRAQASTAAVAEFAPEAVAGPLLTAELDSLGKVLETPARPLVAIIGGSKVSTKLFLLKNLVGLVDALIVGGGIANTFLKASGLPVGNSLYEPDQVEDAAEILWLAREKGCAIPLPTDVVVADELSDGVDCEIKPVAEVGGMDMILDIGPETVAAYADCIREAGTVVWNGPVGAFEYAAFGAGTEGIARAVAESPAFTVAGGGDTVAAVEKYRVMDRLGYVSTAGGAFLEFLEGRVLPGVEALEKRDA